MNPLPGLFCRRTGLDKKSLIPLLTKTVLSAGFPPLTMARDFCNRSPAVSIIYRETYRFSFSLCKHRFPSYLYSKQTLDQPVSF